MRPVRVRLEGFSAYREPVDVDFSDVDFFSLAGPTGSGKSSLIDAMIFALFGRVPRLGGNAVAPAITAGADRARVAFDFEVGDSSYTAVRMAQRTPSGGASVKEARLQQGERVLADGADDVTNAVEELLRLRFEDFTRTVVLPQGEFARFLTATKSERQGLLRNLLGMDMYTSVRELAKTRAAVAGDRVEGARRSLETLELVEDETAAAAVDRRDVLEELAEAMPEREKQLVAHDSGVAAGEDRVRSLADAIERLESIREPDRLTELDTLMAAARSAVLEAEEARETTLSALRDIESTSEALPSRDQITAWKKSRSRLNEVEERLSTTALDAAKIDADNVDEALQGALAELESTRNSLDAARSKHAAHVLRSNLAPGDTCPVCNREIMEMPPAPDPVGIDDLIADEKRLGSGVERLRARLGEARAEVTKIEAAVAAMNEQRQSLLAELGPAPGEEDLSALEERVQNLTGRLEEVRKELADREADRKRARTALEDLADDSRRVSKLLTSAQLKVADLDPPVSESDDVVVQWKELITWREQTVARVEGGLNEARAAVSEAKEEAAVARRRLVDELESHGIEGSEPYAVRVATALQDARALVEAHARAAGHAMELTKRMESAAGDKAVAESLANHLRANGFEQWLMAGALTDLVSGANDLLGQLSGDGYSLHSDESGTFSIIDHRNADEMRSVSTLSGGETFLVSLALALSLAETLAAKGGSGLDAIILDEGFGTLDEESLDTVASVLEELSGRGLMVGVITHVKELAARSPVRYEVHRGPGGADVRLVS